MADNESPNNTKRPKRKNGVKQYSEIRKSDRGYAVTLLGSTREAAGLVDAFTNSTRPSLEDVPPGVLIFNTDTDTLELSDPDNNRWVTISASGGGGDGTGSGILGVPTDGTFSDGAIALNPSGTIVDAIDQINELLLNASILQFASNLGTSNGNTNGFIIEPSFTLGRVATPSGGAFLTNSWDDDTNRDITTATGFTLGLTTGHRITNLESGTLSAKYYNGNNVLLHTENLVLNGSTSNQSSTPSGYLTVSGLITTGSRKEGGLTLQIPTSTLLSGSSGYLRTDVSHVIGINTYNNPSIDFFRDTGGAPSVSTQSGSLVSAPVKYLSGVKYATISGSTRPVLRFSLSALNIWANTYRADPVVFDSSNLGVPDYTIAYNSAAVTKAGVSPPTAPFLHNQNFIYSEDKEVTQSGLTNPDANGNFRTVSYQLRDPFNIVNASTFTLSPQVMINTYGNSSTDNLELFVDENYRVNLTDSGIDAFSGLSGAARGSFAFDSTSTIASTSGAQVINGALIYPQTNYSAILPSGNPNYSSQTGSKIYMRRFKDPSGDFHSNGVFRIDGLSEADRAAGNILIDIKVVGIHDVGNAVQGVGNEGTGWLSLNAGFNIATFAGDDGDGCFVTTNGYAAPFFEFTLGGFSTAFAQNNSILLRITYLNPQSVSKRITRLELTDWS